MYTGKEFDLVMIWHFAKKNLFKSFVVSTVVVLIYHFLGFKFIGLPFVPIASIGTAVAFYVGFKNNQAYDRLWEARRLWGGITNTSRNLATQLYALLEDKTIVKEMLYKHIAYINILRLQLRRTIPWATSKENLHQKFHGERSELELFDEGLKKILESNNKMEYYEKIRALNNPASNMLKMQVESITKLKRNKVIDDYEHSDLVKHINELFNLQGGCERIKTTPLFRQYSIFSRTFVNLFMFLLPFGLIKEFDELASWGSLLTIPFSMLISWVFSMMEQIGEFSENPFDNSVNDIPISTICRNIEIDIKEFLNESNLPEKLQPEQNVLL